MGRATIVFDGECNVCDAWVALLARRGGSLFDFVPAQSPAGRTLLRDAGLDIMTLDTILLIEDGRRFVRSDAILRATARLGGRWRAATVLRAVPRPVRDLFYRGFAQLRYRLFGKTVACRLPDVRGVRS